MRLLKLTTLLILPILSSVGAPVLGADKPNILVIMSDDVGITNISAYSRGLSGYRTPNIDRIAGEGALFTDSNNYDTWWIRRIFALVPAQTSVGEYITSFKEFPPRQKPAKFNVDDALATLKEASGTN